MNGAVRIRKYQPGEEPALLEIFHSAVHRVASRDYSREQIEAWAPADVDRERWSSRIRAIDPFVAEVDGQLVGYADLQADGYIDHFFVSGHRPRCGIGSALMTHLLDAARAASMTTLTSDVSRTAQPFYEKFGFVVVEYRQPELRGVVVPNAFMRCVVR